MYTFKTIILEADKEKVTPIMEQLREIYHDDIYLTNIRIEFEEYLAKHQPDIFLVDISTQLSEAEKYNIIDSTKIIKQKYPGCAVMAFGGKKSTIKDKGFQEAVEIFSGKTIAKINKDYENLRTQAIVKGNTMIRVLTGFFAPYLIGKYEEPGFDRLLSGTFTREQNMEILDRLKSNFLLIKPLLQEENRQLLESALEEYSERDLTSEEIDNIKKAFFFQFTSLTSMENFIDRRRYYAEKDVITDVWESTITFAREIEDSIIFGCHKIKDIVHLKITIPAEYDLKKITSRSKFYKKIQMIEPYGTITIRSGEQVFSIGSEGDREEGEFVEGTSFGIRIKVVVPARSRRGLKRH